MHRPIEETGATARLTIGSFRHNMTKSTFPQRKRLRLSGFDYSKAGMYFVTICSHQRQSLFGWISEGRMQLSPSGKILNEEWQRTTTVRTGIQLDEYVIMPNHVHGIVIIDYPWLGTRRPEDPKQSLDRIIWGFKAACTRRINASRGETAVLWQRAYYDEIIRNEQHLHRVRTYIANNPAQWEFDRENLDEVL